jgi:hypothetical protein
MSVHHLAVAANQTRNFKSELADRCTHAIYGGIVLRWISGIFYKPFEPPHLDAGCRRVWLERLLYCLAVCGESAGIGSCAPAYS